MTLSENTSAYAVEGLRYYTYGSRSIGSGTTTDYGNSTVTFISLSISSNTFRVGQYAYINRTIYPINSSEQPILWYSSNPSIISVDSDGWVYANAPGQATITAITVNGSVSASITLTAVIDSVTIKKDGYFNKVVFEASGKVWYCINHDMIYDENYMYNSTLQKRVNHNLYTHFDEDNPSLTDKTPREYTPDEIKLLYAIDPHGVAYYIQKYVEQLDKTLEDKVKEKDRVFRMLFKREPKYFARTIEGVWYEVTEYDEINDVLSESEVYFGMHPIYDWHTFFEILGVCSSILNIVFATNFFTSTVAGAIIKGVVTTGLLIASGIESDLRNEFANYDTGDIVKIAIDNTLPNWASLYVSLYESLDDLADAMTLNINYNKEIIDYCACHTGYNVLFEMKNGTVYNLKEVCDRISK